MKITQEDQELIRQLKLHEGVKYKPYSCTQGKMTIGVGRNLDDVGISEEEADYLLSNDIARIKTELDGCIHDVSKLSTNRRIVLLNMTFNLGISRLLKFKRMWLAIENDRYEDASREMLDSRWAVQVGYRAVELSEIMRLG